MIGDSLTPKTAPLVVVEWDDITDCPEWNNEEGVDQFTFSSVGWLLENSTRRVVIARSYNWSDSRWREFTVFPKRLPEVQEIKAGDHLPRRGGSSRPLKRRGAA